MKGLLAAAIVLPAILLFVDLGTPSLWDPDEGRHAEIAREMRLRGEWLTPQVNFEPYRQKLPPFYWLLSASLSLPGLDAETASRLPAALLAWAGVGATAAFGARCFGTRAGLLAALVLATSAGYVGAGRLALIDGPFSVLLAVSLYAMATPLLGNATRFPWAFWTALAAATALRGPVAIILVALVATCFALSLGEPRRLVRLRPGRGLAFLAFLLAPLAWMISAEDAAYLPEFFWRYNVLRYVSWTLPGSHEETPLYYLWMAPVLLLPWSLFALRALREPADSPQARDAKRFLIAWLGVVFAFFTLSAAKLPAYALPLAFPVALLVGHALDRTLDRPPMRARLRDPLAAGGMLFFTGILAAPMVGYWIVRSSFPMYLDRSAYLFLLLPLAIPGLFAVATRNRHAILGWTLACTAVSFLGLYRFGAATISSYNSLEVPASLVVRMFPEDAPLFSYGTTSHSLAFYARRPVRHLESLESVAADLNGDDPVALLTKERHLPDVRSLLERSLYYWWQGDSRKLLLANRPPPPGADVRILLPRLGATRSDAASPMDRREPTPGDG